MAVIIISSDSYSLGAALAKQTAQDLHYSKIDQKFLEKVAPAYGTVETKLAQALESKASLLKKAEKSRKKHLAFIQQAVLAKLSENNVVCCGLAAHLYVLGVSHVIKVRILANPDEEAENLVKESNTSLKRAKKLLEKQKEARRKWSLDNFGHDETDPAMYDLVISLSQIEPREAVHLITETAGYRKFKPSTYSMKRLQDLEVESRVRLELIDDFPEARVDARDGTVVVETLGLEREKQQKITAIKDRVGTLRGVDFVEVHVIRDLIRQAAESFR